MPARTAPHHPGYRFLVPLLLAALLPGLTSCREVSLMRGQTEVLSRELRELEGQVHAYDQHIAYYTAQLPQGVKITGSTDVHYDSLQTYLDRQDTELAAQKAKLASTHAYLQILRDETTRVSSLEIPTNP